MTGIQRQLEQYERERRARRDEALLHSIAHVSAEELLLRLARAQGLNEAGRMLAHAGGEIRRCGAEFSQNHAVSFDKGDVPVL